MSSASDKGLHREMKKNESFSVTTSNQLRVISRELKSNCLEPNGQNARLVTTLDPGCENSHNVLVIASVTARQKGLRDRPGKTNLSYFASTRVGTTKLAKDTVWKEWTNGLWRNAPALKPESFHAALCLVDPTPWAEGKANPDR